jgi:uncharacterized LabA/DUF88 family protein
MDTALFIDFENVYYGLVNQYNFKPQVAHLVQLILAEVGKDGRILIKKAYADWDRDEFHGAQAALKKAGIEPAFALSKKTVRQTVSVWKDTADAALMLDAQQNLYERTDIEEFVLVTGDRAFLDLVYRLSAQGKKIKICALESAIAKELTDAVGQENVISLENLLGIEPAKDEVRAATGAASPEMDWATIIKEFAVLEGRLPFVALKLARDRYGFRQQIITQGLEIGIFDQSKVPHSANPFPTTAIKLNRNNDLVKKVLG